MMTLCEFLFMNINKCFVIILVLYFIFLEFRVFETNFKILLFSIFPLAVTNFKRNAY